jgi:hypothetical protein
VSFSSHLAPKKPQSVHMANHDKERPREARMPHTSRNKTSCQSSKMAIRILVSSARKMGI